MIANGLGKCEGASVRRALECLAGLVIRGDCRSASSWSAQSLAMMANGLSKVTGGQIPQALARLARALFPVSRN